MSRTLAVSYLRPVGGGEVVEVRAEGVGVGGRMGEFLRARLGFLTLALLLVLLLLSSGSPYRCGCVSASFSFPPLSGPLFRFPSILCTLANSTPSAAPWDDDPRPRRRGGGDVRA